MKKTVVAVLVGWVMLANVVFAGACASSDPSCSQGQTQGQNQGQIQGQAQGQGQVQGQTSTNLNSNFNANLNSNLNSNNNSNKNNNANTNVNIVDPKQIMYIDANNVVHYYPKNTNTNNVNVAPVTTATGGASTSSSNSSSSSSSNSNSNATSNVTANPTSNSSANNSFTVNNPENKRELPNIPSTPGVQQMEFRGPYGKGMFEKVLPWRIISGWTSKMLDNFPSCNWNCDTEFAAVKKGSPRAYFDVVKKPTKQFLGQLIVWATNPLEMWSKVAEYAFESGAEEVVEEVFQSTFSNKSGGWNVGLGGGATAVSNGNDSVGGSFGGGTGFGSVETRPIEKCQAAFSFYAK